MKTTRSLLPCLVLFATACQTGAVSSTDMTGSTTSLLSADDTLTTWLGLTIKRNGYPITAREISGTISSTFSALNNSSGTKVIDQKELGQWLQSQKISIEIVAGGGEVLTLDEIDAMNDYPARKIKIAASHCYVNIHLAHALLHLWQEHTLKDRDDKHASEFWTSATYDNLVKILGQGQCSTFWTPET